MTRRSRSQRSQTQFVTTKATIERIQSQPNPRLHDFLWQMEAHNLTMHEQLSRQPSPKCERDKILGASEADWMEWQAGYLSGSLLMPLSYVKAAVGTYCETRKLFAPIVAASSAAQALGGPSEFYRGPTIRHL
jgi:hypothetical protein